MSSGCNKIMKIDPRNVKKNFFIELRQKASIEIYRAAQQQLDLLSFMNSEFPNLNFGPRDI